MNKPRGRWASSSARLRWSRGCLVLATVVIVSACNLPNAFGPRKPCDDPQRCLSHAIRIDGQGCPSNERWLLYNHHKDTAIYSVLEEELSTSGHLWVHERTHLARTPSETYTWLDCVSPAETRRRYKITSACFEGSATCPSPAQASAGPMPPSFSCQSVCQATNSPLCLDLTDLVQDFLRQDLFSIFALLTTGEPPFSVDLNVFRNKGATICQGRDPVLIVADPSSDRLTFESVGSTCLDGNQFLEDLEFPDGSNAFYASLWLQFGNVVSGEIARTTDSTAVHFGDSDPQSPRFVAALKSKVATSASIDPIFTEDVLRRIFSTTTADGARAIVFEGDRFACLRIRI